uniref:Uncharacterized protein n=1 Tax=Aegilops tauschii subsp. strangulata TaxID=200361 RepID=A0A453QCH0_AEGTS
RGWCWRDRGRCRRWCHRRLCWRHHGCRCWGHRCWCLRERSWYRRRSYRRWYWRHHRGRCRCWS